MFPAVAQQMAAPLFKKKNNDSIFIKKGHADQLKWVSDAQSSKKSGKKNEDDKNKLYNAVVVSDVRPLVLSSFWDRKCSPNEFLILTPPPLPPVPGYHFLVRWGWVGCVGSKLLCVLRPLCVDLNVGPEHLISCIWTP